MTNQNRKNPIINNTANPSRLKITTFSSLLNDFMMASSFDCRVGRHSPHLGTNTFPLYYYKKRRNRNAERIPINQKNEQVFLFLSGVCPMLVHSLHFNHDKFVLWKSNETTTTYLKTAEFLSGFSFWGGKLNLSTRKNNKNPPARIPDDDVDWSQPKCCIGCIWGRFEGSRQFCSLPRCVLEGHGPGKVMVP